MINQGSRRCLIKENIILLNTADCKIPIISPSFNIFVQKACLVDLSIFLGELIFWRGLLLEGKLSWA